MILDCCNSRIALPSPLGPASDTVIEAVPEEFLDETGVERTYVLVAASRKYAYYENKPAAELPQTFFTKYLADLVRWRSVADNVKALERAFQRLTTLGPHDAGHYDVVRTPTQEGARRYLAETRKVSLQIRLLLADHLRAMEAYNVARSASSDDGTAAAGTSAAAPMVKYEVGPDDVANVVSAWAGIPTSRLLEGETG